MNTASNPANSTNAPYDAIVVGARCAGSPTAMLLARQGARVLLVDRATFPSDTMRAHFVRGAGTAALARWGLLGRVAATGCPPLRHIISDFGDGPLAVPAQVGEGVEAVYGPRRFILDAILVEAAAAAGAEVRQAFTVDGLVWDDDRVVGVRGRARGGGAVTERARLVIGADGLHSRVAKAVAAPTYDATPTLTAGYYGYFSGIPHTSDCLIALFGGRMAFVMPTNDDLSLVYVAAPIDDLEAFRADTEKAFFHLIAGLPCVAEAVRSGTRVERWRGTGDLPNVFRKPYGPGWALVGDAGYHQDPISARGISNAFRDAELLAEAVLAGLDGRQPLAEALAAYERRRNEAAKPGFEEARAWARFDPFPPEIMQWRASFRSAYEAPAA